MNDHADRAKKLVAEWAPGLSEVEFRAWVERACALWSEAWETASGQFTEFCRVAYWPEAVVVDRRTLGMENGSGEVALRDAWTLSALTPFTDTSVVATSAPCLALVHQYFRDAAGNEIFTPTVVCIDGGRISRYIHFDDERAARDEFLRQKDSNA